MDNPVSPHNAVNDRKIGGGPLGVSQLAMQVNPSAVEQESHLWVLNKICTRQDLGTWTLTVVNVSQNSDFSLWAWVLPLVTNTWQYFTCHGLGAILSSKNDALYVCVYKYTYVCLSS